ncbi:MAG: hypothetical protein AB8G22_16370 [Saprospiraceae bacterium]
MKPYLLLSSILFATFSIMAQDSGIRLLNPSFERHTSTYKRAIAWRKCQRTFGETGVFLLPQYDFYNGVDKTAWEGDNYLGLVTTIYGLQESASVRLSKPMRAGQCYEMTVWLANAPRYDREVEGESGIQDHANTVRLEIYGGQQMCRPSEALAEVNVQDHASWTSYEFFFQPTEDIEIITFRAAYHRWLDQYNGHVLIDDISVIEPLDCDRVPENGFTKFESDFLLPNLAIRSGVEEEEQFVSSSPYPWKNEKDIYNYLHKKDLPIFDILVPSDGDLYYKKLLQDKYGEAIICFVLTGRKRYHINRLRSHVMKTMKRWGYPSWAFTFEEKLTE